LQKEFDIDVDWRGFELHPETPPGGMPITAFVPPARRSGMIEYMRRFAAGFGVEQMGSPDRIPNTRRALAMVEFARDGGKLASFRDAAMEAHWRQGKNLEDDGHLREIAASAGLDPEAALHAADDPKYQARVDSIRAEASARGVTGIPTFFFGDIAVVGCQPYDVLADAAQRAGAQRRTSRV
jgi:predicted DsbA family dithiol-disulfide isomerase